MPPLVLMTDDERLPDPVAAALALPHGSMVIVRAKKDGRRAKLAVQLLAIARAQNLKLLVAGDAGLAQGIGAHGVHFPEARMTEAAEWRARRPHWTITVAAHSLRALAAAHRAKADAALLSPVFVTASHANAAAIGTARAQMIVRQSPLPVYALGGIDAQTARNLTSSTFAGIAAIGALIP